MHGFREFIESHPFNEYNPMGPQRGAMPPSEPEESEGLTSRAQAIMADPQQSAAINQRLDQLQQGLDIAGLEPTAGTFADITNVGISGGRALVDKGRRGEHIKNALISLTSMMPFGDIAKLLKNRGMRGAAKQTIQAGRGMRTAATAAKGQRFDAEPSQPSIASQ